MPAFRHLPVTSLTDATHNFEQLISTAWIEPKLEHAWVNYGEGFELAAYMKDGFGVVRLKGILKNGEEAKTAFTLPPGFRPFAKGQYANVAGGGIFGYVQIEANGGVTPVGKNNNVSLSGITFIAEA